jgi:hypothetical protein
MLREADGDRRPYEGQREKYDGGPHKSGKLERMKGQDQSAELRLKADEVDVADIERETVIYVIIQEMIGVDEDSREE